MAANLLESFDDDALGDRERTIPHLRHVGPGHASARDRAPRIEWRGARRAEPTEARRTLAEPDLIDGAFRAAQPELVAYSSVILELLMNRR